MPGACRGACAGGGCWQRPWPTHRRFWFWTSPPPGSTWSFAISFGHYIRQLNAGGVTVLLTTHYLEEAEALCDHVAIIHHGEVIVHEPTAQLVAKLDRKMVTIALGEAQNEIPEPLAQFDVELTGPHTLTVRYAPSQTAVGQVLDAVRQAGWTIADLTTEQSDLEEVFLALTAAKTDP